MKIKQVTEDLIERLLIVELELRQANTIDALAKSLREFRYVVQRIAVLHLYVEEIRSDCALLARLDRRVASIVRSPSFRIAEWFDLHENVGWYVGPATIRPLAPAIQC